MGLLRTVGAAPAVEEQPSVVSEPAPLMSEASESQAEPVVESAAAAEVTTFTLAPETIDEIVRRVVAEMSESVVREIAWEVVPDCVERVVDQLSRESLEKRS